MNFKNMSIRKSLIVGFGTTIVVSLIIIIASLIMSNMQKNAYMDIIEHYVEVNQLVSECRIDYNIAARGLRDAVLSGDMSNLDTATSKMDDLEKALERLEADYPMDDRTALNTFVNTVKEWSSEAKEICEVARTDRESVVSIHYKGTLINGREFDNSWKRGCPEAFRLNQVIEGWQLALQEMRVGDRWIIYIPYSLGYGNRASGPIPAFSTLIF